MSEVIGMTESDCLNPTWLNTFTKHITDQQERYDSTKKQKDCLRKSCDKWKSKYRMACEGTLLAFQETEIQDLQDENDKLMKLNRFSLLNKQKENLGNSTTIINNLVEDFAKVINKLGSRKVSIEGINTTTAGLLQKYMETHPEDDMACCIGKNRGLVIQGKHLIDTDKNLLYGYNPKTKDVI